MAVGELGITWNDTGGVAGTELGRVSPRLGTYDDVGDFASETWNIGGAASRTLSVTRDALGRASSETTVKAAGDSTRAFTYDPAGRLTQGRAGAVDLDIRLGQTGTTSTSISGPTGPEELTYDGRNRLLTRGQTTYSWRDDGALVGWTTPAGQTSVAVDELGRTVGAKLPTAGASPTCSTAWAGGWRARSTASSTRATCTTRAIRPSPWSAPTAGSPSDTSAPTPTPPRSSSPATPRTGSFPIAGAAPAP